MRFASVLVLTLGGLMFFTTPAALGQGLPSVDGFRASVTAGTASGGSWVNLALDAPELNTAGATPGTAWQTGLYQIGGEVVARNDGNTSRQMSVGVWVNGVNREKTLIEVEPEEWDTLTYSFDVLLNEGDTVQLKMYSQDAFRWLDGNSSDFNMTAFNIVPEPSTIMLLATVALGLLVYALRKRR